VIALLLGLVSKARRVPLPIYLVGAVLSAFGVLQVAHAREVGRLQADKVALTREIETRDATIANQHISISQERLNVGALTARLREQNNAIALMQSKATEAAASANVAALRAFNQGAREAEALRAPSSIVPSGAPGMNAWLSERVR
jgi:hypothetical protein